MPSLGLPLATALRRLLPLVVLLPSSPFVSFVGASPSTPVAFSTRLPRSTHDRVFYAGQDVGPEPGWLPFGKGHHQFCDPGEGQLSCRNTTAENTCCLNYPSGQLLHTQIWAMNGPADSFTVHGLWPDHCDGSYDAVCGPDRQWTNISDILTSYGAGDLLSYMNEYWLDENGCNSAPCGSNEKFWEHEWGKHGTCISTIEPSCYSDYEPQEEVVQFFRVTINLFKQLPLYRLLEKAGIYPSDSKTWKLGDMNDAIIQHTGHTPAMQCVNGTLTEVWMFFNTLGPLPDGIFVSTEPDGSTSTCPDDVLWPVKSNATAGGR